MRDATRIPAQWTPLRGAKEALSSHLKEAEHPPRPTLRGSAMHRADYLLKYHTSRGISILFHRASRPASVVPVEVNASPESLERRMPFFFVRSGPSLAPQFLFRPVLRPIRYALLPKAPSSEIIEEKRSQLHGSEYGSSDGSHWSHPSHPSNLGFQR